MNFREFLKDKMLLMILLFLGLMTIEIFLIPYPFGNFIKVYIPTCLLLLMFVALLVEFFTKKRFYENFSKMLEELEEKYLITEIIKSPDFLEGKIFKNWLEEIDKSMYENVNKYKYLTEDYKEYIELWIHEIKLPIAASKMVIENHKNPVTKSIEEELRKG